MRGARQSMKTAAALGLWVALAGCSNQLGATCKVTSDCREGEACKEGYCGPAGQACTVDAECGQGALCRDSFCVDPLLPGEGEGEGEAIAGAGTVRLTPGDEIDFGSPAFGVAIERVVSVLNLGGGVFDVTDLSRAQGTSEEFTWTSERPFPVQLAPGDRVEVTLLYTLADGDDDVGTLLVHTTAAECDPACADPSAVPLDVVSEFKGGRNLLVTPLSHDFGFVPPGQSSPPQAVLLTNDGTLDKVLTVSALDVTGDTSEFSYTLPDLPLYLSPGQSAEVPVVYAPSAAATGHALTVTATANSDAPDRLTGSAELVATSQPPNALVFDPPSLTFPQLAVGQTAQQMSQLKNVGGTPIQVTSLVVGPQIPAEYSVQAAVQLPYTVLPGNGIDVYVDFSAQTGQAAQNTVQAVNDQDSGDVPVLSLAGEGYIPPGGPNVRVSMGPEDEPLAGCECQATGDVPAANVDISYRALASGASCSKPANPSCGLNGGSCDCPTLDAYGDVSWAASRVETVRSTETWIVDERVEHTGDGQDGAFLVRANLVDDCIAVPGSLSLSANHTCCTFVDCDNGAQACYPYEPFPSCATTCEYFATVATSQDCLQRGPASIRTDVRIWGDTFEETRRFCSTLAESGAAADVVTLRRQGGYFTIESIAPGATEIGPGERCP